MKNLNKKIEELDNDDDTYSYYEKKNLEKMEKEKFKKEQLLESFLVNQDEKDLFNLDKNHYKDLIENILFEDLFEDFQIKYQNIYDTIDRKKYILKFLSFIFDDEENFSTIVDKKVIYLLGKSFLKAINEQKELIKLKEVIFSVLPQPQMSAIVASLILNEYYDEAKKGLEILVEESKDLSIYPETINEVIRKNSKVGLRFLCQNFKNIHFNNDSLLRIAHNMNLEVLQMLIDEFKFNINSFNNLNIKNIKKNTLIELLINNNDFKSFYDIYQDKIDWNLNKEGNPLWMEFVNKIYHNKNYDILQFLLNENNINKKIYNYIGKIIFDDSDFFFNANTEKKDDVYKSFFKNNLFNHEEYNFNQGYFIYGVLSKIGIHTMKNNENSDYNESKAKNYFNILRIYLDSAKNDLIPNTPEFNVVGAAIHVYSATESSIGLETAKLIIQKYKEYINIPNPSGKLAIELVNKESPIYNLLIVNGAIPPEPTPTFWKSMFTIFNKKEKNQIFQPNIEDSNINKKIITKKNVESITDIRLNMKNDFRLMKDLLSNDVCDFKIKLKCENMFLKADKLAMIMEKNNLITFYDELFFLNENFSNYLRKSVDSYINTMMTIKEISNKEVRDNKSEEAKNLCIEHIELLKEQLEQMIDNISSNLADNSIYDLKVRGKFLKERFQQNGNLELDTKKSNSVDVDLNNLTNEEENSNNMKEKELDIENREERKKLKI